MTIGIIGPACACEVHVGSVYSGIDNCDSDPATIEGTGSTHRPNGVGACCLSYMTTKASDLAVNGNKPYLGESRKRTNDIRGQFHRKGVEVRKLSLDSYAVAFKQRVERPAHLA